MVADIMPLFLGLSMIDLVFVVIALFLLLVFWKRYFSESKKKEKEIHLLIHDKQETSQSVPQAPQIMVVFEKDISDDEELIKEIADMYISNRTYYYSGEVPQATKQVLSEETPVFLKFDDIAFSSLASIDV